MRNLGFLPPIALLLLVSLVPTEVVAQERPAQRIAPLGDLLIFQSPSGGLWRTDGTAIGTYRLAEPCIVDDWCFPIVGQSGGRLFFLVEAPELSLPYESRYQLWATDGTRRGTRQLTTLPEGLPRFRPFYYSYLSAPGLGLLFFQGYTPETGMELWVTDGTPGGTKLVDELYAGPEDGVGKLLAEVEGQILFEGITPRRGAELWRSDGTVTGTRLLRDFMPGPTSSHPVVLTTLDGLAFFSFEARAISHELWASDGSAPGTTLLYALSPAPSAAWGNGVAAKSQVFLTGCSSIKCEAVRSDGTPVGTYSLRAQRSHVWSALGHSALFSSLDDEQRDGLWISDGSLEGTRPLVTFSGYRNFRGFYEAGDFAYFLRDVGGFEVWVTDGTTAGTNVFATFPQYGNPPAFAMGPQGRLFYVGSTSTSEELEELWVTPAVGGPPGSKQRLIDPSLIPLEYWHLGLDGSALGKLFLFVVRDHEHGTTLWRSDATPSGTYPLVVLEPPLLPGPVAPISATPTGMGTGSVSLQWQPLSLSYEYFYELEVSSPDSDGFEPYDTFPNARITIFGLLPGLPYAFRIRAWNDFGPGPWTEAAATPLPALITPCVPGEDSLCLHGSRFEVRVAYRDHIHDSSGVGWAAPLDFSDDSGAFWFFTPTNLELMVKVLDARVVNGYFWSFFGGLTTLETWITVTDTEAQTNATFYKSPDNLCGQADVRAFPRPAFEALTTHGTCEPGPNHLCLTGNRYRVEVDWRDQRSGHTGVGHAIPGTEDSGFFWFFDDENVELLVKVLDATTVNGHTWVFSGSMTDVEYTLTVTDTLTGEHKQYFHPPGSLCGQADVAAF